MTTARRPGFHLAVPVDDLGRARAFYGGLLGLAEGRSAPRWVDWDFYGHQLVTHLVSDPGQATPAHNPVDGHDVPVPHFGLLLSIEQFHELAARLTDGGTEFVIEPYLRFAGEPKAFRDESQIFAT